MRPVRHLVVLLGLWTSACSDGPVIVGRLHGAAAGSSADAGAPPRADADAALPLTLPAPAAPGAATARDDDPYRLSIELGARDAFCRGSGVALVGVRPGGAADCAFHVERRLFSHALCACETLRLEGESFQLDSFDSGNAAYQAGQTGSAVGVNGALARLADDTQLLGNLSVAGREPLVLSGQRLLVTGDLEVNAGLELNGGSLRVARDLWLGAETRASAASLHVERDAYQTRASPGLVAADIAGRLSTVDAFRADTPCACDGAHTLDIAALVTAAQRQNDDVAAGFDADALVLAMYGSDLLQLPCGRLFASRIELPSLSTYIVVALGRTALFVQGYFKVDAVSTLSLGPSGSGELDVFVAGDLIVEASSTLVLGDRTRPAAMRVFVAGQVRVDGTLALAGQLYAPNSEVALPLASADVDQYGALFARSLRLPTARMHFDRAILQAGPTCTAPAPQRCDGDAQCPDALACTANRCGACNQDADCFEPLRCADRKCQLLVSAWP